MALKAPKPGEMVRLLIVGMVFLFVITSIIDFSGLTSEEEDADIFKEFEIVGTCSNGDYNSKNACENAGGTWTPGIIPNAFTLLIVGMAIWLAWTFTMGAGRLDRKKLIALVIMGIVLYFLWNSVLVPSGWIDIQPIEFAAAKLQSIVP